MTSFYMGRRTFLKTGVAAVAATALPRVAFAAPRTVKIGLVGPAHRAARDLHGAAAVDDRSDQGLHQRSDRRRRHQASARDHRARQPVQSEPRRRGRQGPDPPGQGRSRDDLRDAGDRQSGRRPVRNLRRAVPVERLPARALFLRPPGRSEEGLRLDLQFLLQRREHGRSVLRCVGPGSDQQDRRRAVAERQRRPARSRRSSPAWRRSAATRSSIPAASTCRRATTARRSPRSSRPARRSSPAWCRRPSSPPS